MNVKEKHNSLYIRDKSH